MELEEAEQGSVEPSCGYTTWGVFNTENMKNPSGTEHHE